MNYYLTTFIKNKRVVEHGWMLAHDDNELVEQARQLGYGIEIIYMGEADMSAVTCEVRTSRLRGDWLDDGSDSVAQRSRVRGAAMIQTIKVKGIPPRKGMCPKRPALDGSQGNPMLFCSLKAKHNGPCSWEKK